MNVQQIITLWNTLDARKRVVAIVASALMFAAVLGLARMASAPSMGLLYAGLESGAAGEVVAALEQRSVAYEIRGGAIMVDSARRDELRMTLASEGLPANSSKGYELLDNLSGFGTTSQMFNAAYWRAKEGELARTIASHPAISSARVHIANAGTNPFRRDTKGSASVAVNTGSSGLSPKQARGLKYLVASAVTGLSPEDVSVIDGNGELIGAQEEAPANATDDRAETLRQKVTRLLEARVGYGNAVVEVSVETITRSEMLRERVIDPESRTVISTDTEERSNSASDRGGDVTVASNLPDGDAGNDSSSSQTSETRERVNYEISETEREITLSPGAIKRLSVAVLVNGAAVTDAGGNTVFEPRTEAELADLRDLVSSAVGFDETRGDVITIKTLEFQPLDPLGTSAEPSFLSSLNLNAMSLIKGGILAIVALVLGLFVLRPLLSPSVSADVPQLVAPPDPAQRPIMGDGVPDMDTVLTGEIDPAETDNVSLTVVSPDAAPDLMNTMSLFDGDADGLSGHASMPDPVDRLRALIDDRRDETVEILRSWLEGEEEKAS